MKQVYGHLTSGQKGRANACLMLLTAINGRGKSLSGELVGTFDFTLSSLVKLASPPKQAGKAEREGGNNPEKRSTRAVFTEFALSFLLVKFSSQILVRLYKCEAASLSIYMAFHLLHVIVPNKTSKTILLFTSKSPSLRNFQGRPPCSHQQGRRRTSFVNGVLCRHVHGKHFGVRKQLFKYRR
jgi:hypothetical protein